jgi:hypothetical protein
LLLMLFGLRGAPLGRPAVAHAFASVRVATLAKGTEGGRHPTGKATTATDPAMKTRFGQRDVGSGQEGHDGGGSSWESRCSDESSCSGNEEGVGGGSGPAGQEPAPGLARGFDTSDGRGLKVGADGHRRGHGVGSRHHDGGVAPRKGEALAGEGAVEALMAAGQGRSGRRRRGSRLHTPRKVAAICRHVREAAVACLHARAVAQQPAHPQSSVRGVDGGACTGEGGSWTCRTPTCASTARARTPARRRRSVPACSLVVAPEHTSAEEAQIRRLEQQQDAAADGGAARGGGSRVGRTSAAAPDAMVTQGEVRASSTLKQLGHSAMAQ